MPPRAFNQNQNAADGMLALQSQGYNVQYNFSAGSGSDRPLSECKITDVDGLQGITRLPTRPSISRSPAQAATEPAGDYRLRRRTSIRPMNSTATVGDADTIV